MITLSSRLRPGDTIDGDTVQHVQTIGWWCYVTTITARWGIHHTTRNFRLTPRRIHR